MKIIKTLESIFIDYDIYILELAANHFFINKNSNSILILDKHMKVRDSIEINQQIGIYSTLYNHDADKILLYCPDDDLLIYCNAKNKETSLINIRHLNLKKHCLSPIYLWKNDDVLLSTYDGHFYQLNYETESLEQISIDKIIQNDLKFYSFWQKVHKHGFGYQINFEQKTFIYRDESHKEIVYFDLINNIKKVVQEPKTKYHDIVYRNGLFVFVAEESLTIIKNNDIYYHPIEDASYSFLRARVIDEGNKTFIIALTSNNSGNTVNEIIKYEIE